MMMNQTSHPFSQDPHPHCLRLLQERSPFDGVLWLSYTRHSVLACAPWSSFPFLIQNLLQHRRILNWVCIQHTNHETTSTQYTWEKKGTQQKEGCVAVCMCVWGLRTVEESINWKSSINQLINGKGKTQKSMAPSPCLSSNSTTLQIKRKTKKREKKRVKKKLILVKKIAINKQLITK